MKPVGTKSCLTPNLRKFLATFAMAHCPGKTSGKDLSNEFIFKAKHFSLMAKRVLLPYFWPPSNMLAYLDFYIFKEEQYLREATMNTQGRC